MTNEPLRRKPRNPSRQPDRPDRPQIWAEGGQRPPFDLRALARASLHLSRTGVAPLLAWAAQHMRTGAERVRDGAGRLSTERLGRVARFVPSHLRVAGWIGNLAAILAHGSASADPDVTRGNALVARIEPYLWDRTDGPTAAEPAPPPADPAPVVLPEPMQPGDDPLAAIRDDLDNPPASARRGWLVRGAADGPDLPPAPPGQIARTAIQMSGYLLGWAGAILALPYGLARALWLFAKGVDLRGIGRPD
jgi:hypothetical protein